MATHARKYGEYTNRIRIATVFLFFFLVASALPVKVHGPGNTYHTHEELISMFKSVCNAHSKYVSYESIGKTYEGRDIWIFKIGNPNGGRVMWDGCLHGWEDMGSEIMYLMTEWLLESGDEAAERILERNYVLFVPVVNMDSYKRQNRDFRDCPWGVDLNRNFHTGWRSKAVNDYDYPGPYAGSEPETQVMRNAFQTYRPDFYVNTHYGGGPALGYFWESNRTLVNQVINRINEISTEMGVMPYPRFGYPQSSGFEHPPSSMGSRGMAIGDAHSFGACAWLLEVQGEYEGNEDGSCYAHTRHSYIDIVNKYYPKSLPILIAMCEACEVEPPVRSRTVDTVSPNIEIFSPENKTYTTSSIPLSFTVDEAISLIGYSLDGQTNVTISGNTTVVGLSDGTHTITVYANDTAGNTGHSDTVYFTIYSPPENTGPPSILILSPKNETYATVDISLTFTVDDSVSWMAYNLDGKENVTIAGNRTLISLLDGPHYVIVYVKDTAGKSGISSTVYFAVDTTSPITSILSPENKTYSVENVPVTFTLDESTSWIGYSLDGQANVTVTRKTTLSGLSDGSHSLVVYAKDAAGNTGASETVHFSIETQEAKPLPIWIVAVIVIIAPAGAALLVYFTKMKRARHLNATRDTMASLMLDRKVCTLNFKYAEIVIPNI